MFWAGSKSGLVSTLIFTVFYFILKLGKLGFAYKVRFLMQKNSNNIEARFRDIALIKLVDTCFNGDLHQM